MNMLFMLEVAGHDDTPPVQCEVAISVDDNSDQWSATVRWQIDPTDRQSQSLESRFPQLVAIALGEDPEDFDVKVSGIERFSTHEQFVAARARRAGGGVG